MDYRAYEPNDGPRDPSTFLWNQLVSGEPVILGLEACRAPTVKIKDQVLNTAFRSTFDKKTDPSTCLLLGNIQSTSEGDSIAIIIDQFYTDAVPPSASGALHVPYKFEKGQGPAGMPAKQEYLAKISRLYEDWTWLDLQSGANLSSAVALELCAHTKGPSCSLSIEAVILSLPLKVVPLFPMPMIRNATYESLRATSKSSQDFGFVTLCGHRLCLYTKQQCKDPDLNIVGVWVSGVQSVRHPYVWLVGSQFISNSKVSSRPSDIFIITLLCPSSNSTAAQALFYNCVCPKASTPQFQLWKGQATASVSRVPTATNKVITVPLEKAPQGKALENFEWAQRELIAHTTRTTENDVHAMPGVSRKNVAPPTHGIWPTPPAPMSSEPINASPTVPDVSFYGSPPFCGQNTSPTTAFTMDTNLSHRTTVPLVSPTERHPGNAYSQGQFHYPASNYPLQPGQHPCFPSNSGPFAQPVTCTGGQSCPPFSANTGSVSSSNGQGLFTFPASTEVVSSVQNVPVFPATAGTSLMPTNFSAQMQNLPPVNNLPESYNVERRFETGRPNSSPEVYELIRRQDLQLSELKMQIQQLLDVQHCQPRRSIGDQDQDRNQDGRPRKELHTANTSTMTETYLSPPEAAHQLLLLDMATQTDYTKNSSQCPLCGRQSPQQAMGSTLKQTQQQEERDDEEYTLFFPEKAQRSTRTEKPGSQKVANAFFVEDKLAFGSSAASGRPVSGNTCRTPFGKSPQRRLESTQHTVSFSGDVSVQGLRCESTGAKSTLETFLHPRLDYQTLVLNESRDMRGGGDLSFQANCIARKYCPAAPSNVSKHSPPALGERKNKGPHGNALLRQVLAQEAQKKAAARAEASTTIDDTNGVSFATREYLKNYGLLDDGQQSTREGYEEDVPENILNISELRKLPKLL